MSEWFDVIPAAELPTNERKVVMIQGISILILNVDGKYYAIHNQCTHQNFPLDEGPLEGVTITCPFHGAKFCIKTGEVLSPPAFEDITTYPLRIVNDILQINMDS